MRTVMIVLILVLIVLIGLAVVGWRLSDGILVPKPYALMPEFEIVDVRSASDGAAAVGAAAAASRHAHAPLEVLLPPQPEGASQFSRTEAEGRYGLRWEGGAGRLGPVTAREGGGVARPLTVTDGRPPRAGDPARMDVVVFHGDPSDRDLTFTDVTIPGPLGALPGWWLPGSGEDAVLVLHGRRRADRSEALRILPLLRRGGASVLVASYRNHDASPMSPDGFFHYGETEAEDALASLAWLTARGARRVLVVGFSMGGAISMELLQAWPDDGPEPVGLLLDSPLLDPRSAFTEVARRSGAPFAGGLARLAVVVASLRAGVDFAALDQRRAAPDVEPPVLLIGGVADDTVPISLLDDFADALPDAPTYLRLEGVQHVEGWNAAPSRYEDAVRSFLDRVGMGAGDAPESGPESEPEGA